MRQDSTEFDWVTLYANATSPAVFIPVSPWMPAPAVHLMRLAFELAGKIGNFQCQAAYQLANDVRSPDGAVAIGDVATADGMEDPSDWADVGTSFKARAWFRVGFLCTLSSGSTLALARAAGRLQIIPR
ncbi:hypothetical protein L6R53_07645 [Myxococcota bacterium]|nr:hypothetical protein [Myxococcota bacterium]